MWFQDVVVVVQFGVISLVQGFYFLWVGLSLFLDACVGFSIGQVIWAVLVSVVFLGQVGSVDFSLREGLFRILVDFVGIIFLVKECCKGRIFTVLRYRGVVCVVLELRDSCVFWVLLNVRDIQLYSGGIILVVIKFQFVFVFRKEVVERLILYLSSWFIYLRVNFFFIVWIINSI